MEYEAVLFDFFDVIHSDSFHTWMSKHGLTRTGDSAEASRQLDAGNILMPEFYEKLGAISGQTAEEVEADFESAKVFYPEVAELVKALKRHYKLALISNAASDYLRNLITKHDLAQLFDEVVISSEVRHIKPNPEIFEHALIRLGVGPDRSIFIDDSKANIEAAGKLGITGVHYTGIAKLRSDLRRLGLKF